LGNFKQSFISVCVSLGLGFVFSAGLMLGRAVSGEQLQHPRTGVSEVMKRARRHDADIATRNVALDIPDLGHAAACHEIKQLVVPFVDLTANLASEPDRVYRRAKSSEGKL